MDPFRSSGFPSNPVVIRPGPDTLVLGYVPSFWVFWSTLSFPDRGLIILGCPRIHKTTPSVLQDVESYTK